MKLKRSLPDLIVSDLRMPRMSGFELLAAVRQRFPHIASIAISGDVAGNHLSGLLADLFLEKQHDIVSAGLVTTGAMSWESVQPGQPRTGRRSASSSLGRKDLPLNNEYSAAPATNMLATTTGAALIFMP
jgi:hypothetical protein